MDWRDVSGGYELDAFGESRRDSARLFGGTGRFRGIVSSRHEMKTMVRLARVFVLGATSLTLGCNPKPLSADRENSVQARAHASAASATVSGGDNPGIDLQCLAERIQKPSAPFHWSYRKVVPPLINGDWEADISPNSIAGTFVDSAGTRPIRAARLNSTSWNTAVMTLTGPLPASTFALVNNPSATVRAGTENVNGENTIKYVIDTSRDNPSDAALIKNILGANGFIKGSAWVTRAGCPIKFVLNVEEHHGKMQTEHYEANVTQR
ncbi:MAG TPA: hypothetical protein VJO16_07945 [Candidatus Acidoferrum sp.]|nr:hypothetical protein [Candidatus Acidoferrum sp.]